MRAVDVVDTETGEIERAPEPDFGTYDPERLRPFLIDRQGTTVVLYAGLVAALHWESRGFFALETRVEQLPSAANGQTAVCSARVRILDRGQPDVVLREASGIGDADEGNVGKQMTGAIIRMAETRAKGRALRDALNIGLVTVDELGPEPASPAVERIQIKGKWYPREAVERGLVKVLAQAEAAGLQLAPAGQPGGPPLPGAPLPAIAGFSQEVVRRLEARSGAVHANGAGGK